MSDKMNEDNKVHREFLVNEGSISSNTGNNRQVLTEPLEVMEQSAKVERKALVDYLAEMAK
jgi:hypothetical protein